MLCALLPCHRFLTHALSLVLSDVESLVRHAVSVEVYRAMMSCRRVALKLIGHRLRTNTFDMEDPEKLSDVIAILKFALAPSVSPSRGGGDDGARSTSTGNAAELPLPWEIVRQLCEVGAPNVIECLLNEAMLNLATCMKHVVTFESKHPISDKGFTQAPKTVTLPHVSFAVLEFDRRTNLCDYFLPKYNMSIASAPGVGCKKVPGAMYGSREFSKDTGVNLSPMVVGSQVTCVVCVCVCVCVCVMLCCRAAVLRGAVVVVPTLPRGCAERVVSMLSLLCCLHAFDWALTTLAFFFSVCLIVVVRFFLVSLVAGGVVNRYEFDWKPMRPGMQRRMLHPLWGVKARLRPLAWEGMNDFGAVAQPLGWPLLRLLMSSSVSRRNVRWNLLACL